ncbi:MAG: peroxide stress protein YaaA [Magnetococcales bacterium]|nr:peroxide stress protein YaaA [Magnetococcales bacterium]
MILTLISPAKKQLAPPVATNIPSRQPRFIADTAILAKLLAKFDAEGLMSQMKISPGLAALNVERNQKLSTPTTAKNSIQAGLMFQGDTYVGLDSSSFSKEDWSFAEKNLAILSGLYGLLSPVDLVHPHRLEMGNRLKNPRGETLYAFWKDVVTNEINRLLEHKENSWVVNLASHEYFKVVLPEEVVGTVITPIFKDNRGGKLKVIGIKAKKARGKMARFIIQNRLLEPEPLKNYNEDGYHFQAHLSNNTEWVFVCDE